MNKSDSIIGIDIGTTKICTVVTEIEPGNEPVILGIGHVPSRGLRKGVITNIEHTISSIRESKLQAEQAAGVAIDSAFVSMTGAHIQTVLSNTSVAIDPHRGITVEDMEHVLDKAQHVDIPSGRRLIDVYVRDYIVDGEVGVSDPLSMNAMRLEANALLITTAVPQIENIYRAVNQAGIDVENIILAPIASAEAVLDTDERESGIALVDIGGGTTDIVVYRDNGPVYISIYPVGGDHFDSDIAYGVGLTARQAEHLKIKLGGVSDDYISSEDMIEIARGGGKRREMVPLNIVAKIIQSRLEEILFLVYKDLERSGFLNEIPSGLVLTGGMSLLPGITELASDILGMGARIGYPRNMEGMTDELLNPMYSTAVGLAKLGAIEYREKIAGSNGGMNDSLSKVTNWGKSIMKWITQ